MGRYTRPCWNKSDICKSIFDFSAKNKYDIVISEGVLHHTNNPKLGFEKLIKNQKKMVFVFYN